MREAINRGVAEGLRPLALGLVVLFAAVASWQFLVFDDFGHRLLGVLSLSSAALALGLLLFLKWRALPPSRAHPVASLLLGTVLLNGWVGLLVTGDPSRGFPILLVIVAAGVLFLDRTWFLSVVLAGLTAWFAGMLIVGVEDLESWGFGASMMIVGTGLAVLVQHLRLDAATRVEQLRRREQLRQVELESALKRTEASRNQERETRGELEEAVKGLSETEERFRRLTEATMEGVLIHRDGRILDANPAATATLGRGLEELLDLDLRTLVTEDSKEAMRAFMLASPSSLQGRTEEVEMIDAAGEAFPASISGRQVRYRGQSAVVAVFRDIRDQKKAEQLLRRVAEQAEANSRMKSAFLTNMSHELRTPLNSVIGFADILVKNKDENLTERQLDFIERIASSGRHLLSLISDILDLSTIEAGRLEVTIEDVELGELLNAVERQFELQCRKKGLDYVTECPDRLEALSTDRSRLHQILLNLVDNAVKFTVHGSVTVRVDAEPDGRPRHIHVTDTGIGIPVEKIWSIFDAFQQAEASTSRRYEGQGLGLAITRSICDRLGYELSVESAAERGSTFTVDLDPPARQRGEGSGEAP